jgi:hypothetical protein
MEQSIIRSSAQIGFGLTGKYLTNIIAYFTSTSVTNKKKSFTAPTPEISRVK